MKTIILQSLIVLLSIFQINAQGLNIKKVNLERHINQYDRINLSKLGTKIQYLPLKGGDKGYFLKESKFIDFSQEFICVCDFQSCYLFKKNGDLFKKIGRQGKGPGEYGIISGMCFSTNGKFIYLSSYSSINIYSIEGNFIKSVSIQSVKTKDGNDVPIRPWAAIGNNLFLANIPNYSGNQKNKLIVFDENGHIIKEFKNYQFFKSSLNIANTWDNSTSFYQYGDLYTVKILKNDTLFRLTKTLGIYPDYIFSFGKYRLPFENEYHSVEDFFSKIINYITLNSILESKKYFYLTCDFGNYTSGYEITKTLTSGQNYTYKNTLVKGIYNKITDQITFLQPSQADGFINDLDGGMNFFPQKILNDSIMVSWVDAYQIKAYVASDTFKNSIPKYTEKKKELEKLANSLSENDNPVLMLVKLKE